MHDSSLTTRSGLLIAIIALAALIVPGELLAGQPPALGPYDLTFAGELTGEGQAAVSAQNVLINVWVKDSTGASIHIVSPGLTRNGNYFSGTATAGGLTIDFAGRLDPSDTSVKESRLACTYRTSAGGYGRIVGIHR